MSEFFFLSGTLCFGMRISERASTRAVGNAVFCWWYHKKRSNFRNQLSEFMWLLSPQTTNCMFFAPSGWPLRKSNNFRKEMQPLHDRVIFFVAGEFIISSSASVFVLRSTTRIWYLHMNYDPVTARCKLAFIIWGPSRPV